MPPQKLWDTSQVTKSLHKNHRFSLEVVQCLLKLHFPSEVPNASVTSMGKMYENPLNLDTVTELYRAGV